MGFHYRDGGYVGGCGAQIGGLLLVPVVALVIGIFDYIPFRYVFWGAIALFILFLIIGTIIGKIQDKQFEKEMEELKRKKEKGQPN